MINSAGSESQYLKQLQNVNMGQIPSGAGQGVASGSISAVDTVKNAAAAKAQDNAVAQVAEDFDIMKHPVIMMKNLALCFLMSAGFTQGTNWLMSSKQIADGASHIKDFQDNRLYQMGTKIDKYITNTSAYAKAGSAWGSVKTTLAKVPVPNFVKEVYRSIKSGSFAPWDKTGMYSMGKGVESMNEAVEFLSGVAKGDLATLGLSPAHLTHLKDTLDSARKGVINNTEAFKRINALGYMDKVSAKVLKGLTVGDPIKAQGFMNKFFGTTPNVNLSWAKVKYFNGLHNQGPIAKAYQKLVGYVGEASGNGVLGGKMAVIMGSFGLVTGFNAASRAEKGDKLKAFMEDYIGFTLGSYLMSFVVGKWFNKFLGITELGIDSKRIKTIAEKLKVETPKGLVLETVIAHNRQLKDFTQVQKLIDKIDKNKLKSSTNFVTRFFGADDAGSIAEKLQKLMHLDAPPTGTISELRAQLVKFNQGKSIEHFASIRKEIQAALKSKITIGSIVKGSEHNSGNFLSRLGKYILQKPLRKFGQLLSVGKYTMFTANKGANFFRRFKTVGGGVARIIIVAFFLTDPFRKLFMRGSHLVFGKPKHSQLDEEKKENEANKADKSKQAVQSNPQDLPKVNVIKRDETTPVVTKPGENLLQKAVLNANANPQVQGTVQQPQPQSQQQESLMPAVMTEVKRSYVPSPYPSPEILNAAPSPQEVALNSAFAKADAAEQAAMKFLH